MNSLEQQLNELAGKIQSVRHDFVENAPKDYLDVATFAHRLSQQLEELVHILRREASK